MSKLEIGVDIVQKALPTLKKFQDKREQLVRTDQELAEEFLKKMEWSKGICEFDSISELITRCVNSIKEKGKETVLVIEDLDRIDPAHMFRILNILIAHIDRKPLSREYDCTQGNNKFNFDKVITVCDFDKMRAIFHHFYGIEANFDGYISKFMKNAPFRYSIRSVMINYFEKRILYVFNLDLGLYTQILSLVSDEQGIFRINSCRKREYLSIRDFVNILDDFDSEIISEDIFVQDNNYYTSVNSLTRCLVLLKRFGISINDFINKVVDEWNINSMFNLIGNWWFASRYVMPDHTLRFPIESLKNSSRMTYSLPYRTISNDIRFAITDRDFVGGISREELQLIYKEAIKIPMKYIKK